MTTEFLRPDGTVSTGDWRTESAGTDLHDSLLETSPVDADYIISGGGDNDISEVTVSNPSGSVLPPSGGVWTIFSDPADGNVQSFGDFGEGAWAGVDNGTGAPEDFIVENDTVHMYLQRDLGPTYFGSGQGFPAFDTDGVTVDENAVVEVTFAAKSQGTYDIPNSGDQTYTLLNKDWGETVGIEDWVPSSSFSALGTGSSVIYPESQPFNSYLPLVFETTPGLISSINTSGMTRLAIVDANQATEPVADVDYSEVYVEAAEQTGTVNDPYLFIDSAANAFVVRYRYKKNNDNNAVNIKVDLVEDTTVIATNTHTGIGTDWADGEISLTEAEAASITDHTDLRLRFTKNPA